MANRRAKVVELNEASIAFGETGKMVWNEALSPKTRLKGDDVYDIGDLVASVEYYESIDSPFLRCDISIVDAIDLYKNIRGKEIVKLKITSESSKDDPLEVIFRVFKMGSFIKNERAAMYILHCVSHETFLNEANRVFGAFGPCEKHKDKENIPQYITKQFLKGGQKVKKENFETPSKVCFSCPNWRPYDVITYLSDKVLRQAGSGQRSKMQSGFLFYENKHGFHFKSIDKLCEGSPNKEINTYTYMQSGVEVEDEKEYFKIQSISFPDKVNHLEKLRSGLYKTSVIGVSVPALSVSALPTGSGSGENKTEVSRRNFEVTYEQVFQKASTIDTGRPFQQTGFDSDQQPATRFKLRVMPTWIHQPAGGGDPEGGTKTYLDTLSVSSYATARYALLNAIQLTIVVPGNTALTIGEIIKVSIPSSKTDNKKDVKQDRIYSGKYLIASLKHVYRKEGITTTLYLTKDSIREDK